ncbi:MAG: class I SAM-dependent methyltransferase [Candidatus Sulfotelmatobacter sp.]
MSATQSQIYAAPFDAVAARYDDTFTSSSIGRAQRSAVWRRLERIFVRGDRILEIGCGTGVDACFLANRGVHVVACDSSSQMIEVAGRRVHEEWLEELVQPRLLAAEALSSLSPDESYDGAFSNFGALNCIGDLPQFAHNLATRLKPGATALLCWIGPFSLWEVVWHLGHGNRQKAFRRLHRDGVRAKIADGAFVHVHYPTVRQIARTFAPHFALKSVRGIGVAIPPSYVENWAQHHPKALTMCEKADSLLGQLPGVRMLADHILLRLQRTEQNEAGKQ